MKTNTTIEINTANSVSNLLGQYPNVSLRKLALATETTYTLLLKASKTPVVGQPYDPDFVNYEKIAEYFNRREIDLLKLDWNSLNSETKRAGTVVKDMSQFQVGSKVYIRKNPTVPYEIVYMTGTHVVLLLEGSTEPLSWSYNTFLLNGPQFQPREAKEVEEVAEEQA